MDVNGLGNADVKEREETRKDASNYRIGAKHQITPVTGPIID